MLRLLGLACGALAVLALAAGCSSSSKPKTQTTPAIIPATVLPSGTVVIRGTPVVGAEAATVVAAATAGVPLVQGAKPQANGAKQGTPGAGAPATVIAGGTVVVAATPAAGATGTVPSPTPFPPAGSGPISGPTTRPDLAPTPASVAADAGFMLTVPPNPSGAFDVAVTVSGIPNYGTFSVELAFDAALLKVTGIDYGGAMGTPDQVLCPPNAITGGSAIIACTHLGSQVSISTAPLAIFHFQVLNAGTANLHFTSYANLGSNGTFLVGVGNPHPITLPLHDATITVSP